jgi:AraC-like DNA-binding protein
MLFCDMPPSLAPDQTILSCPFSGLSECANSKSYTYDNNRRGNDPFVIIQRTESGFGIFNDGTRLFEVHPEFAFVAVVPDRTRYFFDSGDPWVFTWINFYGNLACQIARGLCKTHGPVVPLASKGEAFRRFHLLAEGASSKSRNPWRHSSECFEFLSTWMGELVQPSAVDSHPADMAVDIMEQRFREPLAVKEIASQLGLTREHLSRLFMERHGVGPAAYLRSIRSRHSARLLSEQNLSLREIALRSGFPSVIAMHRAKSPASPLQN